MKEVMPPGAMPKEIDMAIKRLEAGEDPDKIEQDMGDVFGQLAEDPEAAEGEGDAMAADGGSFSRDRNLYDY